MRDKCFIDTNILLYLYSNDLHKKNNAKKILNANHNISVQVLNEFSNVSLKKFHLPVNDVKEAIEELIVKTIVNVYTSNTILNALRLHNTYKYQFYDCLILATALENNCNILYSEDMQSGQIIDKILKIINPFE